MDADAEAILAPFLQLPPWAPSVAAAAAAGPQPGTRSPAPPGAEAGVAAETIVSCPCCHLSMPYGSINAHIDAEHGGASAGAEQPPDPRPPAAAAKEHDGAGAGKEGFPDLRTSATGKTAAATAAPRSTSSARGRGAAAREGGPPAAKRLRAASARASGGSAAPAAETAEPQRGCGPLEQGPPSASAGVQPGEPGNAQAQPRSQASVHQDALEKVLSDRHQTALGCVSAAAEGARARVAEEQARMEGLWRDHAAAFEAYTKMGRPSNGDEQRERNDLRDRLLPLVGEVQAVQESLLISDHAPAQVLQDEQCAVLATLDSLMQRLGSIRAGVVQLFKEKEEEIKNDHRVAKSIAVGFAPMMEHIDGFVRVYAKEVEEECAQRRKLNEQQLEELRKEVQMYVSANESPARHPKFARAQEEVAGAEARLEEERMASSAAAKLLQSWDTLHAKIPTGVVAVVERQNVPAGSQECPSGGRSWWSGLWPRGQKRSNEASD